MLLFATEAVFWFLAFQHGSQGLPEPNAFCRRAWQMLVSLWIINDNKVDTFPYKHDLWRKPMQTIPSGPVITIWHTQRDEKLPRLPPWPFWRECWGIASTTIRQDWTGLEIFPHVKTVLWTCGSICIIHSCLSLVVASVLQRFTSSRSTWNGIHNPFCFDNVKQSNRIRKCWAGLDCISRELIGSWNWIQIDGELTGSWSGIAAEMNHAQ